MTPSAGKLRITLSRRDGAVKASVAPPEALPLESFLRGKPAEEAARLVPLIFNICAAAQEAAVRSALDLPMPPAMEPRVTAETLREHVLKLALIWPTVLGQAAGREAGPLAGRALDDPEAASALRQALFAPLDRAPGSLAELESWMDAGETAPARAFATVAREWDAAWGRADLPLFDPATAPDWPRATQGGRAVENSAACRHGDAALLREVADRHGHGMLWRMAVRLIETSAILDGAAIPALAARGTANAARGAMLVEASAGPDGVAAFRRLSPTDFALAEGGVLAAALATLPAEPDAPLKAVAQMAVETVDPCIATRLEVQDA